MTPQNALNLLIQATEKLPMVRADHALVNAAIQCLSDLIEKDKADVQNPVADKKY